MIGPIISRMCVYFYVTFFFFFTIFSPSYYSGKRTFFPPSYGNIRNANWAEFIDLYVLTLAAATIEQVFLRSLRLHTQYVRNNFSGDGKEAKHIIEHILYSVHA